MVVFFKHQPLLHKELYQKPAWIEKHHVNHTKKTETLLRIVELIGPGGKYNTFTLSDEVSTYTMIDAWQAERIGVTSPFEKGISQNRG